MSRAVSIISVIFLFGCPEPPPPPTSADTGGSINAFVRDGGGDSTSPPARSYDLVRIDDQTRPGEGLPLDAVELCDPAGRSCALFGDVIDSSDPSLDYGGVTDGPNSQDSTCTEQSFTKLAAGDFVVMAIADRELEKGFKLNVWTATSGCPFVAAGAKPFAVSVGSSEDGDFVEVESCEGTCTVSVP